MRSDRTFLDSKLYTKLVGQLAKERLRNVIFLEVCISCGGRKDSLDENLGLFL